MATLPFLSNEWTDFTNIPNFISMSLYLEIIFYFLIVTQKLKDQNLATNHQIHVDDIIEIS
jgi:hypothetical protein